MKIPTLPEDPELRKILLLRAEAEALRTNRLAIYVPHAKQKIAHAMGKHYTACAIFGGNRTGKSECARMEMAYHLTGEYPDDWTGRRWDRPTRCYAATKTWAANLIGVQKMLLGDIGAWGTGSIPKRCLGPHTSQGGVAGAVSTVKVKHVSGRYSTLVFKAYEQGRELFQSDSIDFAWLDEEPPWPVFSETVMRVMDSRGYVLLAFTPLLGMSEVAAHFRNIDIDLPEEDETGQVIKNVSRGWVNFEWADNPFLTPETISAMRQQFANRPHELAAREKGEPSLGSGACYPVNFSSIVIPDFEIPRHWKRGVGADFGYTNPTAFLWGALDPNTDTRYYYREYKVAQRHPSEHSLIFSTEDWVPPIFGDPSCDSASPKDGEAIVEEYEKYSVTIFPADRRLVDSGIARCMGLFLEGKAKIMESCRLIQREIQLYSRDENGKVIKRNEFHGEHLCDAMRYDEQNVDLWQVPEYGGAEAGPRRRGNYDPYGGWS